MANEPAHFRRWVEPRIVMVLAGEAAESYAPLVVEPEPHPEVERLALSLSSRASELLAEAEARPAWVPGDGRADGAHALDLAITVTNTWEAEAYVAWLRTVAARLVRDNIRLIGAVAEMLLRHEVLDRDAFLAIAEGGAIRP
jgi:hypothetical protein